MGCLSRLQEGQVSQDNSITQERRVTQEDLCHLREIESLERSWPRKKCDSRENVSLERISPDVAYFKWMASEEIKVYPGIGD